jgi:hypothetical protein
MIERNTDGVPGTGQIRYKLSCEVLLVLLARPPGPSDAEIVERATRLADLNKCILR